MMTSKQAKRKISEKSGIWFGCFFLKIRVDVDEVQRMQDVRLPLMGVGRDGGLRGSTVVLRGRGRGCVAGEAHEK
jgi:hypothetical protein